MVFCHPAVNAGWVGGYSEMLVTLLTCCNHIHLNFLHLEVMRTQKTPPTHASLRSNEPPGETFTTLSVADQGLFWGGGANSKIGCANILFCKFFAENCMKMKEFGPNRSLGFANARIESFLFFCFRQKVIWKRLLTSMYLLSRYLILCKWLLSKTWEIALPASALVHYKLCSY